MLNISFIGDLTVDVYPKLKKTQLGGASLISARWAKKLGAKATILAAVGNDEAGKSYLEFIKKNHLSQTFLKSLKSPTSRIEIFLDKSGERRFGEWQPGAFAKYHLEKKDFDFLKTQDAVILPVYFKTRHLLDELITYYQPLIQSPITNYQPLIIIDFDDLSQFDKQTAIIEKYLSSIDIVKVGLDIDKDKDLIEKIKKMSLSSLSLRGRVNLGDRTKQSLFLITLGSKGSLVFINGKTYHQKAQKVKRVVNATGAGDAFLAGFLVSYLKTRNIQKSLIAGSKIAAKAISHVAAY